MHASQHQLNALPPDVEPRATRHIAEMIAIIETLIANGNAYEAEGHVLFNVPTMASYGVTTGSSGRQIKPLDAEIRQWVLAKAQSRKARGHRQL